MTQKKEIYRHYKGGVYLKLMEAKHSETEEIMVIYQDFKCPEKIWCRPKVMFEEVIEVDGMITPRFLLIDEGK